jgi:hypothetical protein
MDAHLEETTQPQSFIHIYSKHTQNVCMCTIIGISLILLFIMSPISSMFITSTVGKVGCILLLSYALYTNLTITNTFSLNAHTDLTKTNLYCSYLLSGFIFLLLISVVKKL